MRCILAVMLMFVLFQSVSQAEDAPRSLNEYLLEKETYLRSKSKYLLPLDTSWDSLYADIKNPKSDSDSSSNVLLRIMLEIKFKNNYYLPFSDKELFQFVLERYQNDDVKKSSEAFGMLGYFVPELLSEKSDIILEAFSSEKLPIDNFYRLQIEFLRLPACKKLKEAAIKSVKKEMKTNPQGESLYMTRCARMGDEKSKEALISMLDELDSSSYDYRECLRNLLELYDRDANIAVLKQFRRNIGAPDFYSEDTVRYSILTGLYDQYGHDEFFKKHRRYFIYSRFSPLPPLDNENIGNEEKMKEFFLEFQKWAKERLDYDLDLDGVEYKINAAYEITPIFDPSYLESFSSGIPDDEE